MAGCMDGRETYVLIFCGKYNFRVSVSTLLGKYLDIRKNEGESLRYARRNSMMYTRSLSVLGKLEGVTLEWV